MEGVIVLALSVCLCVCPSMCPSHYPGQTNIHGLRYAKRSLTSWVVVIPKEGRARPHFSKKKKITFFQKKFFFQKIIKSRCHTKRRAGAAPRARSSFGMTPTQAMRDLFAWRRPHVRWVIPSTSQLWKWGLFCNYFKIDFVKGILRRVCPNLGREVQSQHRVPTKQLEICWSLTIWPNNGKVRYVCNASSTHGTQPEEVVFYHGVGYYK